MTTKKIREMYRRGVPVTAIAKKNNSSRQAIYQRLRGMEDYEEVKKFRALKEEAQKVTEYKKYLPLAISMLEEGQKVIPVARKLGIPYNFLREELKGTVYDNTPEGKERRNEKIRELYKKGLTQDEIADRFFVSQNTVSRVLLESE